MLKTSDEARDLLRDFAESNGISVSALLEAIARRLPPPAGDLTPRDREVVEEARAIDAERRRRG